MRVGRIFSCVVVVGLLVLSIVPGVVQRAAAQISGADSVGFMFTGSYFEADYSFTWTATDCIEAELLLNGVLQNSFNAGCGPTGTWYGYLQATPAAGTYSLDLYSSTSSSVEYAKSWSTPGLAMSVSASAASANVGDTVSVDAKFTLAPSGPDYLTDAGTLSVTGASTIAGDAAFAVASSHYLTYYGITPNPLYTAATIMVPLSFGTAGTKPISVTYTDPFATLSGTLSLAVSDPSAAELNATQAELSGTRSQLSQIWSELNSTTAAQASAASTANTATTLVYAALVVGAVGAAVGLAGFMTARKARRERTSAAPAPPPSPPASPPSSPPLPPSPPSP